ncbi:cation diffusion facilitator family transporter [Aneurinibacillus sp. Ricciae_BoGa-3]|uniref:cation diffusion facilitator family transporter n=1 Tax=Aneurinibacillus sp. Ricciae_BoGa-3 TaxID=3022697 RepID=UPI002341A29E|nr:cation diffusion facilitator family transporter [Aneurinibacillus sp. Ricciae_BoGa-3]WCK55306.1 cation diffusion facilitator family transporter [Aneurinibacillus sp. Ricciae_BoGa-3]
MGSHHHHHHDHHGHSHAGHSHHHGHNANKKSLLLSFLLITAFMIVEFIGGFFTNSLALISDAGHMLSDSISLFLSYMAVWIAAKPATHTKTYGYKRLEILAALFNGVALGIISIFIYWEAFHRLFAPAEVSSGSMMLIATLGFVINILVAFILMRGDTKANLNMRSALLHVFGDLLGSLGAIVAGLLIWLFGWNIADPIASVIVATLVLISGWRVTRDSINVLMEGVPEGTNIDDMRNALLSIEGIEEVHDLHVWTVTSGFPSLSCHVVVKDLYDFGQILRQSNCMFKEKFNITHTTIQIEDGKICEEDDICDEKGHHH